MSGALDDPFARRGDRFDRIDALRREILDHLDRQQPDVPLHKRGFGVMDDEPPT